MRKIGILGGTFDPVHIGHLRIAIECKENLRLDEIRMIPCAVPALGKQPVVNIELRKAMLELALQDISGLVVDDREMHRSGHSYTIDTLLSLRQDFPDDVFYLIIGSDSFQSLCYWHNWQQLFELAHIVIAQRPEMESDRQSETGRFLQHRFIEDSQLINNIEEKSGRIICLKVSQLGISSSQIRRLIKNQKNVQMLVPDAILQLIDKNALYQ